MQDTSIESHILNEESGSNSEMSEKVQEIYKAAGSLGLTTNEMILKYHQTINTSPDVTPKQKVLGSSMNNALKARRTDMTYKGIIRKNETDAEGMRKCSVTGRSALVHVYNGSEYSEEEQTMNELIRTIDEINRLTVKKQELAAALSFEGTL